MRILKLFIAVVLVLNFSAAVSVRGAELGENKLVAAESGAATTVAEIAVANVGGAESALAFADAAGSFGSGAVSSEEVQAALRLSPAIGNSVPFTPTVTLPEASPVPEPGALMFVAMGFGLLLQRRMR